mgnify:CR=1 FL=1
MTYEEFLAAKIHSSIEHGFAPGFVPEAAFGFQRALLEWACRIGRAAIFAECGMGKTLIELAWAQNVVEHTNRPVLVMAPLAVSAQTVREGEKFGIAVERSRDGSFTSRGIVVTNYEKLHLFDASKFAGIVCDEASILKSFDGATRTAIIEFSRKLPYRLLATATPAPNDTIELGNASEALGHLGYTDMLSRFFTNAEQSLSPIALACKWRLKPHATVSFWRWVCSWARAVRRPSDLGFDDGPMVLPALHNRVTVVEASVPRPGQLFVESARDLREQRQDRRATINKRCEAVAQLSSDADSFVAWCHLNDEGDLLENIVPGAIQVSGKDSDEEKEEKFEAFCSGQARVLVTKSKVAGLGMNWQHCNRMSFFPSHSYEQMYQSVRRCWRYGQKREVTVDIVTTNGEPLVLENLERKARAAEEMFDLLVKNMKDEYAITPGVRPASKRFESPAWLKGA